MTGIRQNPPRKEGCRLPPLLHHQQLGSQDKAIEQRGQGQKAQWWVRKANRGVSQVGKSLEGGRSPQQKSRGMRRHLGPIFNTAGRDTPAMQGSKAGAAFNQAEWTQGSRPAGKWDFSKETWKTVRVHMSKKRLQWKKKNSSSRELKTKEATETQRPRPIGPKHLSIMTNMRAPPPGTQLTVTRRRHCHGYFCLWFLAPSPISHFLVACCFHCRCCELLSF